MRKLLAFYLLLGLSACAIIPDTPMVGKEAASQGTPVALGEPVWLGDVILTPLVVSEDSRCPPGTHCVWEGRLTVSTRITSTHWTQTAPLTLGEPYELMGRTMVLTKVYPEKSTPGETTLEAYRFVYEAQ